MRPQLLFCCFLLKPTMSSFAFIKKFNPETIVDLPYSEAESIALLNGYKLCVWNGKELLPLEWSTREWAH